MNVMECLYIISDTCDRGGFQWYNFYCRHGFLL